MMSAKIMQSKRILFTVGNVDRDIGRHSVRHSGRYSDRYSDSRSIVGRQSVDNAVDSRSIVRKSIGRVSVDISTTHLDLLSVTCRWYIGQLSFEYQSCVNLSVEFNGFIF